MASLIDPKSTYGAYMLGVIISARCFFLKPLQALQQLRTCHSLYGITVVQTYGYYRQSTRDAMYMKILIFMLWILNTLHEVLLIETIYDYLIGDYGNPLAITHITGSYWAALSMSAIIEFVVKGLFCLRLFKLGKNWRLVALIAFLALSRLGELVALIVIEGTQPSYATGTILDDIFYWTVAVGVAGDILLATAQAMILWKWQTGFKRTNSVLWTLMIYTINTCALTSIVDIAELIVFALFRNTESLIYVAVYHQLPGMYINALLATLNAREELRELVYGAREHMSPNPSELPHLQDTEAYTAVQDANDGVIQITIDGSAVHSTFSTNGSTVLPLNEKQVVRHCL
ncbi:hypothetical protein CERSUDRAFT_115360 [Gelatoporia subvermispora B]|uniref:DUF6534 domain-containing protein n=1 Tax=Ceriporiopsis subvermispora (strain B) TaxID=914234 RepID=M2QH67_CERS8|nr:hypothetical protein CERSUDRAFT_115360 [Gelatoporia subvermispora B]